MSYIRGKGRFAYVSVSRERPVCLCLEYSGKAVLPMSRIQYKGKVVLPTVCLGLEGLAVWAMPGLAARQPWGGFRTVRERSRASWMGASVNYSMVHRSSSSCRCNSSVQCPGIPDEERVNDRQHTSPSGRDGMTGGNGDQRLILGSKPRQFGAELHSPACCGRYPKPLRNEYDRPLRVQYITRLSGVSPENGNHETDAALPLIRKIKYI